MNAVTVSINIAMVLAVYFAIINQLFVLALVAFATSKWRIFAARPRLWLRNIINSGCDIAFGLGVISLMQFYLEDSGRLTLAFAVVLFVWQLFVRPRATDFFVRVQALLCQFVALAAIWTYFDASPDEIYGVFPLVLSGLVGFVAANHVLRQYKSEDYEEELTKRLSMIWAFFVIQLSWLAWLWAVVYVIPFRSLEFVVPQIAIVSSLVSYYIFSVFAYQPEGSRTTRRYLAIQTLWVGGLLFAILLATEWNNSILS